MLATLQNDEVRQILADSDLAPMTADTITDPGRIMVEIEKTRERSCSFVFNECAERSDGRAAVVDAAGRPFAAVHIAGSLTKWSPGEYEERFLTFRRGDSQIAEPLGFRPFAQQRQGRLMSAIASSEREIANWLAERRRAMLSLLSDLVGIDSGTSNIGGVETMATRIDDFLRQSNLAPTPLRGSGYGGGLRVELPGSDNDKSMLLMGHLDTVFPAGEGRASPVHDLGRQGERPWRRRHEGRARDEQFRHLRLSGRAGETPGPSSGFIPATRKSARPPRQIIEAEARNAAYSFNSEPWPRLRQCRDRAARRHIHATFDQGQGRSFRDRHKSGRERHRRTRAQDPRAPRFDQFRRRYLWSTLAWPRRGQSVNTTAPSARALIDLRFGGFGDRDRLMAATVLIVERSWTAGSSAALKITGEFVPLAATRASMKLLTLYQLAARDLGFAVEAEATGSCADSGFAAAMGATTLCGLGPVGGNAHSPDEYVEIETIVPRAQAVALTILRLGASAAARHSSLPAGEAFHPSARKGSQRPTREACHDESDF